MSYSITQFGKPVDPSKYTIDLEKKTFKSIQDNLVLDFSIESEWVFETGSNCKFITGSGCTFKTGSGSIFITGSDCNFDAPVGCTFKTGWGCTFKVDWSCIFTTGSDCTFKTGSNCTFDTESECIFKTSYGCTFDTGDGCTFDTDDNCIFNTGSQCTFITGNGCAFNTGDSCTFDTGIHSVIVRRDEFEVIQPSKAQSVKLFPPGMKGHIVKNINEDFYHFPGHSDRIEIIDGIVSKVISSRKNVLKVINLNDGVERLSSYIVTDGTRYAHGITIKQARQSLIYKISDRDTSRYKGLTLDSKVTFAEGVELYRTITGSCESQTKSFAERHRFKGKKTIAQIIDITQGQYNHNLITDFFNKP
jgi:hypothetical protein